MVHVTVQARGKEPPGAGENRAGALRRGAARSRRAQQRARSALGDAPSSCGHGNGAGRAGVDARPRARHRPGDVRKVRPSRRVHHRGVSGDARAARAHGEAALGRRGRGADDDPDPAARLPGGPRAARHVEVPS